MKSFYSIVYANINTYAAERISIGLILVSQKSAYFRYSEDKLNRIKGLFQSDGFGLLKTTLKSAYRFYNSNPINTQSWENSLFPESFPDIRQSEKYINYLSAYCSNTMTFTPPIMLEKEADEELLVKLFNALIFYDEDCQKDINDKTETLKNKLYPQIVNRVNLEKKMDSRSISSLIFPVDVSFIGKNDRPVVGKILDFEKRGDILENALGEYHILMKAFDKLLTPGQYFVIGNEPSKDKRLNHNIWHNLHDSDYISLVSADEIQKVEEYVTSHNVHPFFTETE